LTGEPASTPRAATPQVQQAVDRAIKYLQTESAAWLHTRKCAACHHVPLPLWALGEAQRQGYAIDKKFVADTVESLLGSKDKLMSSRIFPNPDDPPDPRPQGRGLNMGLPMLAVAARSLPSLSEGQKQSLKLIAGEIVTKQQPDGSWEFFATLRRPPINESQTTDAAWIILALQGETGPDAPKAQREALSKGVAWLDAAKHSDLHQDKVLKVLLGSAPASRARRCNRRSTSCWHCNASTAAGARPCRTPRATPLPPARPCTSCRWPVSRPGGAKSIEGSTSWSPRRSRTAVGR
jgi:hypothetical protein